MDNYTKFEILAPIETKSMAKENDPSFLGYVEGFASTTDRDRYNDIISEKAQKKAAKQLEFTGTVFYNHNYHGDPIGKVVKSTYTKESGRKGIYIKVGISKTAEKQWTLIQEGILKSFSIGGKMKKTGWDEDKEARIVDEMDLYEVSIVGMPANPFTTFGYAAKSYIGENIVKKRLTLNEFIKRALDKRGR